MRREPYLFPPGASFGTDNVVLWARSSRHRVENFAGPLSIKTVKSGQVTWVVNGRDLVVDASSFLVISSGEAYSMDIHADKPVETCCAFFASGFVERIAFDLGSPLECSLEVDVHVPALPYLSTLHSAGRCTVAKRVLTLSERCSAALSPSGFEEEFVDVAAELLQLYGRIRDEMARIPAARNSTRQELFRRLLLGREYFHSHAVGPISLTSTARAAGLSLFHFHRSFTHAFGQTPHAYLTELRLARARRLIEDGLPVLQACLDAGFSSPSAFSRLFRSHFGQSPSSVKRKLARSGKR